MELLWVFLCCLVGCSGGNWSSWGWVENDMEEVFIEVFGDCVCCWVVFCVFFVDFL